MLDSGSVAAFLQRIGAPWEGRPTSAALAELHEAHILSVPYENIDFHLGKPIDISVGVLSKIVGRRRGGCCYELTGAFCEVLRALGYDVTVLAGRIMAEGELGPVLGHMVMRVVAEDSPEPWLVDVGYGRGFLRPLRFNSRVPQVDPHGIFQLADAPDGDLILLRGGKPQYLIETRPRLVEDFIAMLWWARTAPDSPHINFLYCTLPTATGRVTISGTTLILRENGQRTTEIIENEADLRAAYRTWFGFDLDEIPMAPVGPAGPRVLAGAR